MSSPGFFPKNPDRTDSHMKSYNIAWAGIRYNWLHKCADMHFNQFTPPDEIINAIKKTPGMHEACNNNIEYLAIYAPQLFFNENVFSDKIRIVSTSYKQRLQKATIPKSYKCLLTKDGQIPTCNRIFALMDKDFVSIYLFIYWRTLLKGILWASTELSSLLGSFDLFMFIKK